MVPSLPERIAEQLSSRLETFRMRLRLSIIGEASADSPKQADNLIKVARKRPSKGTVEKLNGAAPVVEGAQSVEPTDEQLNFRDRAT